MSGALYIWIIGAVFLGVLFLLVAFAVLLWLGHRMEKKETGASHGFLELPKGSGSHPVKSATDLPPETK